MASVSSLLSEEQFLCSICLEVFNNPVTTPCGHNYCKACITQYWDSNHLCQCPLCKKPFHKRPDLVVNTFISEMAAQFKSLKLKNATSPDQQPAKPGEVSCDVCSGTKIKALKSCLVCLASYCETHLEPHQRVTGLKKHKLIDHVENLEDRMCKKHERPLELFCKTDQMYVCQFCTKTDHKLHHIVPLKDEYGRKKPQLGKKEAEVQQMIQKRQLKIQEIKHSVEFSKKEADREIANSVQVFTALVASIERGQAEIIKVIEEKQKTTEKHAEGFIKELEQEITELKKRSTELEQISHTEDHLHLLQSFPPLSTPPHTKDWTKVKFHHSTYVGTVRRAVETINQEMKMQLDDVELKQIQQYAVDVTLNPDTAHPDLILSEDGKQVQHGDVTKKVPDNAKRFSKCPCVLGEQSFSSFYFEVQVKGKTKWDLGVARESINRKGNITASPTGGFWIILMRNGIEYWAVAAPPVLLSLRQKPQKVGVFVDYEEGLVSFYDVEARAHIYSFTGCTFTEKLYPFFSPGLNDGGKNSAPLIISPVKQKTTEKQADGFIKELEQEITELKKRSTELEQLSHTEDHLHLLQSFPSLSTPPHTKDWTKVNVHHSTYVGTARRAVETINEEMKMQLDDAELKQIQQYAVDVTLDPVTAHPYLILSEDGKQVQHGDVRKKVRDNPKRFSECVSVLGKHSFSSGRFYFEVLVKGKSKWDVGVSRESINRKGSITVSPTEGFWVIWMRNGNEYKALAGPSVLLSLRQKPQKVGVFVDYEEGLVSFYDVEARALIYSFIGCTFTEKLYPLVSPGLNDGGKNSAPLIISPVNK